MGTVLMVVSMLYMAVPIGIIGNAFNNVWTNRKKILFMKEARERLFKWGYGAADLPNIFAMYDTEGTGYIDFHQFQGMVTEMGLGFREDQVLELFSYFDKDGGGSIDEQEFVREMFPKEYPKIYSNVRTRALTPKGDLIPPGLGRRRSSLSLDNLSRKGTRPLSYHGRA